MALKRLDSGLKSMNTEEAKCHYIYAGGIGVVSHLPTIYSITAFRSNVHCTSDIELGKIKYYERLNKRSSKYQIFRIYVQIEELL